MGGLPKSTGINSKKAIIQIYGIFIDQMHYSQSPCTYPIYTILGPETALYITKLLLAKYQILIKELFTKYYCHYLPLKVQSINPTKQINYIYSIALFLAQGLYIWGMCAEFSWDSQQGILRTTSILVRAFWYFKCKVLKYSRTCSLHNTLIPNLVKPKAF